MLRGLIFKMGKHNPFYSLEQPQVLPEKWKSDAETFFSRLPLFVHCLKLMIRELAQKQTLSFSIAFHNYAL